MNLIKNVKLKVAVPIFKLSFNDSLAIIQYYLSNRTIRMPRKVAVQREMACPELEELLKGACFACRKSEFFSPALQGQSFQELSLSTDLKGTPEF